MNTINDGPPGDLHRPRDLMSRAFHQASIVAKLLKSEEWNRAGGVSSGLRSYALCLCDSITSLVKESEMADAEAFDTILTAVANIAAELTGVVDELLELQQSRSLGKRATQIDIKVFTMPDLGHMIRAIREARQLSLADVAKAARIGISFLSLIEHNARRANSDTLRLVARALHVPEDLFLTSAGLLPVSSSKQQKVKELAASLDRLQAAEATLRRKLGISDESAKRSS